MSKKVKITVLIPLDEKGVANRRAQLPSELIRWGFEVELIAVQNGATTGDSHYS